MSRILLDPTAPTEGNGTQAAPTPTTPVVLTPAAANASQATPPPTTPVMIQITTEEYRQSLERDRKLADIEAQRRRDEEAKEAARLKAIAEKGDYERAMTELRTGLEAKAAKEAELRAAAEAKLLDREKDLVIAASLAGTDWRSELAAKDAMTILRDRFEAATDSAGNVAVVEKSTRRPAAEVLAQWKVSPAADHFVRPTSQGGAGATGSNNPGSAPAVEDRITRQLKEVVKRVNLAPGLAGNYGSN